MTIMEVAVASALLITALVPILQALTVGHASSRAIEEKTRSLMLAQYKLEDIKARSIYTWTGTFVEMNASLDGPYLCSVWDDGAGVNLRQITVDVGYDDNEDGILQPWEVDVSLVTLLARRI